MTRLATLVLAAGLAGCGTTPDERPVTFEVVTLSVLAPTCGQVQCHSTSTHIQGYGFDTLAASRDSLRSTGDRKKIWEQIEGGEMPPDAPMADEDKDLVKAWLDAGAPGL
ncbi:hypothetical protein BH11MYX3_BH11MYX3_24520 [soil metagenome]